MRVPDAVKAENDKFTNKIDHYTAWNNSLIAGFNILIIYEDSTVSRILSQTVAYIF